MPCERGVVLCWRAGIDMTSDGVLVLPLRNSALPWRGVNACIGIWSYHIVALNSLRVRGNAYHRPGLMSPIPSLCIDEAKISFMLLIPMPSPAVALMLAHAGK